MLTTIEVLKEKIGINPKDIQNVLMDDNLTYEIFLNKFNLKRENIDFFFKESDFLSIKKKFEIIKDKTIKHITDKTDPKDVRVCYKLNQDNLKIEKYIYDNKNNKIIGNIFKTNYEKAGLEDYYEDKSELLKKLYSLNVESIIDIIYTKPINIEQNIKREYINQKVSFEYKKVHENNINLIKFNIKNPELVNLSPIFKEILIKEMLNNLSKLTKPSQKINNTKKINNSNF